MERDIQELYRENLLAEEAGNRAQEGHDRREQDLRERLQDVRRALEIAKRNLDEAQHKVIGLTGDLSRSRKGELKYKKKVRHDFLPRVTPIDGQASAMTISSVIRA